MLKIYLKNILKNKNQINCVKVSSVSFLKKFSSFRTIENNPLNHTEDHIGHFYKLSPDDCKHLFSHGGFPKSFEIQTKTFNETCLMIRKPSINIINCLKNLDYNKPPVKFVLYGKKGSGKSLILAHLLHYGFMANFLLVHIPWVGNWMRSCKESSISETNSGYIDLNLDAAAWLLNFKTQNQHILKQLDLRTSQDYMWSKRESTLKDAPLLELIDHGINRIKFASDCTIALANEIKILGLNNIIKCLILIDGYNGFFYPKPRIFREKKKIVHPHNITLTKAFLDLTKCNWKNSAIILTVDELAIAKEDHKSHLPKYLLGKDGFEYLDPFLPVSVENFSNKEFKSCMDYYRDRRWIQVVDGQDEELAFISSSNPFKLMQLCASL